MELSPYLDALRRDLAAAAAPGGPEVSRAAELLASSLDSSARLCLLEALSDAAAEITARLGSTSVEVRLRGRSADLVVTEAPGAEAEPPPAAMPDGGDLARITLRLPEPLKEQVERAANAEGISVNAWLVRAITGAVHGGTRGDPPGGRLRAGRRVTGFAQA
jgi:HicB family